MSLIVTVCILMGVGPAAAGSNLTEPDGTFSQVINLGGGQHL